MKKLTLLATAIVTLSVGVFGIGSFVVSAQEPDPNTTGQALEIAPPVLNLTADPGETVTAQISLRDISSGPLVVTGEVNDFVAGGEDGTPRILLDEDAEDSPYSLKDWIEPLSRLTLEPREIQDLPITIRVPANASPGGYFGVIRFTATPPELEDTGVSLSASLGALVLLRVNGDAVEGLEVEEFSTSSNGKAGSLFESTPIDFIVRLKNTGNVQEIPAGQVAITDMFGKTIATVNVNLPPRNVLPGSIRKFEPSLDSSVLGNKQLFGRYTADLAVTYGSEGQTVTSSHTFWVIPYRLIGIVIALLVIGFFALRYFIGRYNRSIINKAQNKPRRRKK